jgi:hypothetical protein
LGHPQAKVCNANCSRNGVVDSTQAFELTSNWLIQHVESGLCVTASGAGALSMEKCVFDQLSQMFVNDYTRIRNKETTLTNKGTNATLTGNLDGTAAAGAGGDSAGEAGQWSTWAYFPNTKQLRNQYTAKVALGYPRCLATC